MKTPHFLILLVLPPSVYAPYYKENYFLKILKPERFRLFIQPLKYLLILLFIIIGCPDSSAQSFGASGGAIKFDGVDDYINFGDVYSDLTLPFTISGWVFLDPSNTGPAPIFSNRNCDPIYTGFRLIVNHNVISMDYGDGRGGNNSAYRRGKNATVESITGNWNHITAVVRGPSDMDLYLNGINAGGSYSGGSTLTMDSSKPGFGTSAYFISNGVIYRLNGIIDDIRLWNRALSESEIRSTMCVNLVGNESGLIGYWNFNEGTGNTVFDLSSNEIDGTFVGSPTRVSSGAPIGDVSNYLYSSTWAGTTLSLTNDGQSITVSSISSTSQGVHLYSINDAPSDKTGMESTAVEGPYFGVFMAQQNSSSSFSVQLNHDVGIACDFFSRNDNSTSSWSPVTLPLASRQQRIELIQKTTIDQSLELGDDVSLCDQEEHAIATGITHSDYSFEWSNAQTTTSITVSETGEYFVTVTGPCTTMKDTVTVQFFNTPEPLSLGEDVSLCDADEHEISTGITDPNYSFTWSDLQTTSSIIVTQTGEWVVTVNGPCAVMKDTVTVQFFNTPEPLSLGEDVSLCDADEHEILSGITDPNYSFSWSNMQTTSSVNVTQTGEYFVTVTGPCAVMKDTVTVQFFNTPEPLSLGEDVSLCDADEHEISTGITDPNYSFTWSDLQTTSSIIVTQTGEYFVTVTGPCAVMKDTVTVQFLDTPQPLSLGEDVAICDADEHEIPTGITDPQYSFMWNDSQTTPSIIVSETGEYFVTVTGPCAVMKDTITVQFLDMPEPLALGQDVTLCDAEAHEISTGITDPEYSFTWSNNNTSSAIIVNESGEYFVTVTGPCGIRRDSITVQFLSTPAPLSLGEDILLCDTDEYELSTGIIDPQYSFAWSNNSTTPSIHVTQPGEYFVVVTGPCAVMEDTVNIEFLNTPGHFSLGQDIHTCNTSITTVLRALTCEGCSVEWQDGAINPEYQVTDFGTYWAVVKNNCGQASDSITISRTEIPSITAKSIPNVITPNDDGKNDFFIIPDHPGGQVSFSVYNRWGKLVYHNDAYKNDFNGEDLTSGLYFTTLHYACTKLQKHVLQIIK